MLWGNTASALNLCDSSLLFITCFHVLLPIYSKCDVLAGGSFGDTWYMKMTLDSLKFMSALLFFVV